MVATSSDGIIEHGNSDGPVSTDHSRVSDGHDDSNNGDAWHAPSGGTHGRLRHSGAHVVASHHRVSRLKQLLPVYTFVFMVWRLCSLTLETVAMSQSITPEFQVTALWSCAYPRSCVWSFA